MSTRYLPLVLASCLTVPLAAQGSPLVVKTADSDFAYGILDGFNSGEDLPKLQDGMHWVLMLDDGGQVAVKTGQDLLGTAQIEVQPAELMDMFASQVAEAKAMARGAGSMALAQAGLKTREAVKIINGIFDFPRQIEFARIIVHGDPSEPADGFALQIWADPIAGTWFETLAKNLKPTGQGAPALDDPGAVIDMAMDLDIPALGDALAPINELMAGIGASSKEQRTARAAIMLDYWKTLTGSMGMTWNMQGGGMKFVAGVNDGDKMTALYDSPEFQAWQEAMQSMNPQMETEIIPNALEHRGVKLMKSVASGDIDMPMGPMPFMKDGKITSYGGVAGSYLVAVTGGEESDVTALVDQALDQRIEHKRFNNMLLGTMNIKLAEMLDVMTGGMVPPGEVPEHMSMELGTNKQSVFLKVDFK